MGPLWVRDRSSILVRVGFVKLPVLQELYFEGCESQGEWPCWRRRKLGGSSIFQRSLTTWSQRSFLDGWLVKENRPTPIETLVDTRIVRRLLQHDGFTDRWGIGSPKTEMSCSISIRILIILLQHNLRYIEIFCDVHFAGIRLILQYKWYSSDVKIIDSENFYFKRKIKIMVIMTLFLAVAYFCTLPVISTTLPVLAARHHQKYVSVIWWFWQQGLSLEASLEKGLKCEPTLFQKILSAKKTWLFVKWEKSPCQSPIFTAAPRFGNSPVSHWYFERKTWTHCYSTIDWRSIASCIAKMSWSFKSEKKSHW